MDIKSHQDFFVIEKVANFRKSTQQDYLCLQNNPHIEFISSEDYSMNFFLKLLF